MSKRQKSYDNPDIIYSIMETPLSPNDFYDYANTTIVEMRLAGMNKKPNISTSFFTK